MDAMNEHPLGFGELARALRCLRLEAPESVCAEIERIAAKEIAERVRVAVDAGRISASLDRENLNSQLDDWRERALRCEKLRAGATPLENIVDETARLCYGSTPKEDEPSEEYANRIIVAWRGLAF